MERVDRTWANKHLNRQVSYHSGWLPLVQQLRMLKLIATDEGKEGFKAKVARGKAEVAKGFKAKVAKGRAKKVAKKNAKGRAKKVAKKAKLADFGDQGRRYLYLPFTASAEEAIVKLHKAQTVMGL